MSTSIKVSSLPKFVRLLVLRCVKCQRDLEKAVGSLKCLCDECRKAVHAKNARIAHEKLVIKYGKQWKRKKERKQRLAEIAQFRDQAMPILEKKMVERKRRERERQERRKFR